MSQKQGGRVKDELESQVRSMTSIYRTTPNLNGYLLNGLFAILHSQHLTSIGKFQNICKGRSFTLALLQHIMNYIFKNIGDIQNTTRIKLYLEKSGPLSAGVVEK